MSGRSLESDATERPSKRIRHSEPTPEPTHAELVTMVRDLQASVTTLWQVISTSNVAGPTISNMNAGNETLLLNYFGIIIDARDSDDAHRLLQNGVDSVALQARINAADVFSMVWGATEEGSYATYWQYFLDILKNLAPTATSKSNPPPSKFTPLIAHVNKSALTTTLGMLRPDGHRELPCQLRGTTDILLSAGTPGQLAKCKLKTDDKRLQSVRVVCQLKPKITSYNHCMCQATGELFATDLKSKHPVVSVLTDLKNDWTFQWLSTESDPKTGGDVQVLHRRRFKFKRQGLTALASVLNASGKELMEKFHCVKVKDLAVANTDGVGPERSTAAASAPAETKRSAQT